MKGLDDRLHIHVHMNIRVCNKETAFHIYWWGRNVTVVVYCIKAPFSELLFINNRYWFVKNPNKMNVTIEMISNNWSVWYCKEYIETYPCIVWQGWMDGVHPVGPITLSCHGKLALVNHSIMIIAGNSTHSNKLIKTVACQAIFLVPTTSLCGSWPSTSEPACNECCSHNSINQITW